MSIAPTKIRRKHPDAKCEECPLYKEPCAPTDGPADAKIAVVSRSPGYYEGLKGKPFTGLSGKVLDHLLNMNGVRRRDVLATNVVLCQSDAPPLEAIRACSPRLQRELEYADTIIAAGSEAAKELAGLNSLTGSRGYPHRRVTDSGRTQRVIISNNPAVVLRDDSTFPNLVKDFKLAINPTPPAKLPEVEWTNDRKQAERWIQYLARERGIIAADIESRGLAHSAALASIAFSSGGTRAFALGEQVVRNVDFRRNTLKPFLETNGIDYLWHNGKFDVRNLRHKGINARVDHDTMLLSYALDERSDEEQVHRLEYLVQSELAWPNYEPKIVREWKAAIGRFEKQHKWKELEDVDVPEELYTYNALDAAGTSLLYPLLHKRADDDSVLVVYEKLLLVASEALTRVELTPRYFDMERAADILEEEVYPRLDELKVQLQMKVGDASYNPNSATQNASLVYDKWGLTHNISRRGKERSVDKPVYTELAAGRFGMREIDTDSESAELAEVIRDAQQRTIIEWAGLLADYKELEKQKGTYLEGMIKRAEVNGGKLYTDFKLLTSTGRLSSSNPNVQNITRTKAGLPSIRSLFIPSPGGVILNADYSQAEMRVIAALSGDSELARIYRERLSLHRIVAARFYGDEYTGEQYVRAKNMDFGTAYGQTAYTFQEKHDIPQREGEKFIKWWWQEFSGVAHWRDEVHSVILSNGEVVTEFGRKRRFHLITKENKDACLREGFNFIPQSTAHDFTLWSLCQLVLHELDPEKGLVILEGHDALTLDVREDNVDEVAKIVKQVMDSAPKESLGWDFPFESEIQVGPSWGEVEAYEF